MEIREDKLFFNVFPKLRVEDSLKEYFETTIVEHVVNRRQENKLYVLIASDHLITYDYISRMEGELMAHLANTYSCPIYVVPRFELQDNYTLSVIMDMYYKKGILAEWEKRTPIYYSQIHRGVLEIDEENSAIKINIPGNIVNNQLKSDIESKLKKDLDYRFNINIGVVLSADGNSEFSERFEKMREYQLDSEVNSVISKVDVKELNIPESEKEAFDEAIKNGTINSTSGIGEINSAENANDASKKPESGSGMNSAKAVDGQESVAKKATGVGSSKGEANATGNQAKAASPSQNAGNSSANGGNPANNGGRPGFNNDGKNGFANGRRPFKRKAPDDPEVFYGRNVEGDVVGISELEADMGKVVIRGQVSGFDERELRSGKFIFSFVVTDFKDSIRGKAFMFPEELKEFKENFVSGGFYLIKAEPQFDSYEKELMLNSIEGIKKSTDFRTPRMDHALEKRVELCAHTVKSEMASVISEKDLVKTTMRWGHKAVAVTDLGVIQGFPVAAREVDKDSDFKIIFGVSAYLIDDMHDIALNSKGQSLDREYVVFDIETTGFSASRDRIIEIGAVKVREGRAVEYFSEFINPERPIPYHITNLTSITDDDVKDAPNINVMLPRFIEFIGDCPLVAHNAQFDVSFIERNCKEQGIETDFTVLDTVELAHCLLPDLNRFKLDTVAKRLNIKLEHHHRAVDDAGATAKIFMRFVDMLKDLGIENTDQLNEYNAFDDDMIKKARYNFATILVKNEIGRVNLNHLISASHIKYFNQYPRIPKSLIMKYREGLIIGSGNQEGELFSALERERSPETIDRIVKFYDYLEIVPPTNLMLGVGNSKSTFKNKDELLDVYKRIVELGEEYNKPVVASGDAFYLNPEDRLYMAILSKGDKGRTKMVEEIPECYLRTTEEMLEEFAFLGTDKAREVVITNTNFIADCIEKISPVYPDKCPPQIPNSEETLTQICYDKAHEIYGPDLPPIVEERLTRELNSIIGNGFAVMYIIAQKLVWDSNDHGYLVGSRGSVGSSFVATMSGITEVNPLSAHYICPKCYYVDFDSDEVRKYAGSSGCDMPDKLCPKCGHPLNKEGHDIPFETFLGFNGDKEPDIDLNFSGDYQGCAHKYTEVLFGEGHAFRAGTVGSVADKTAYGYVLGYYEEIERQKIINNGLKSGLDEKEAKQRAKDTNIYVNKRRCEMERLAVGCTGVKRTTGQHPGGIIVVPGNMEIDMFTPIQRPANDMTVDITTTHFEYHSIDHNLLKLDILGHDDPSMIRRMEDETGIDAKTIKLDDKEVMSLFASPEALGITPADIGGVLTGSLGIPEFGTDFTIQMLVDTKPKSFSDLVRISGLSHGTDVWLGNAQELIKAGVVELSGAICCRDDIMVYLINKGLEKGTAFKIMESVRKGKGIRDEWIPLFEEHGVPDWYVGSCRKIKYMFPKAHAAAYVMMAWRIAWFKINYPPVYYAAYYSIRAKAMDYKKMCQGQETLKFYLDALKSTPKEERSPKDEELLKSMKIVEEMYARGIEFIPIDLMKVHATKYQIFDGKIMPSLTSIDGVGESAANLIVEAAKEREFISKEDMKKRASVGDKMIETLDDAGITSHLQDTNQMTFSFLMN